MKNFEIPKIYIDAIKSQALSSVNEIYGWLVGYEKNDIPYVLAIIKLEEGLISTYRKNDFGYRMKNVL